MAPFLPGLYAPGHTDLYGVDCGDSRQQRNYESGVADWRKGRASGITSG